MKKYFVLPIIVAVLAIGLQSCSKPNPESMSEIVLETISIYKSGGDYLGYIESLEKKYKCVDYKDSLKLEISSDTKIVRKMFTSEDEKVKVRLTGTEDSDWRDLEFIIYPLTETSESYSVDKCYKEIKEKAKEHNVFYYSLYLYRYEVPNSVGKIKVDDVETPFSKDLDFITKTIVPFYCFSILLKLFKSAGLSSGFFISPFLGSISNGNASASNFLKPCLVFALDDL